jgi:RNA-directed DNA polymerase
MTGAQEPENVSTKCQRIAMLGQKYPERSFTSLAHHMDLSWMLEAYRRTRKDGAVGVDGQSAREYGEGLPGNLERLLEQAKSGEYQAPPVRRVHIPKGDGKSRRPIGIPVMKDRGLQAVHLQALTPVAETMADHNSYGFRPKRRRAYWDTHPKGCAVGSTWPTAYCDSHPKGAHPKGAS